MKPAYKLPDEDVVKQIQTLESPAYRNLSKFHRERLEELKAEARRRRIKI